MPRKQFFTDLEQAKVGILPPGISSLQQGEDDGQVLFTFEDTNSLSQLVRITAMIPDVSNYPKTHEYMIFCEDDTSVEVSRALEDISGINRKTVFEMLDILSTTLSRLSSHHDMDTSMSDSQIYGVEDESEDDIYPSDDDNFEHRNQSPGFSTANIVSDHKFQGSSSAFRSRVRTDLSAVRAAGFKAGHLGHLLEGSNCFVTVSVRISKLGISEEAMQAWQIRPSEYLILLLQFPSGYKTYEELQKLEGDRLAPNIGFRVLTGKHYKPSFQEAIEAFTTVKTDDGNHTDLPNTKVDVESGAMRVTFISRPLNALLQERLMPILRYRSAGMDWRGGENMYMEVLQTRSHDGVMIPDRFCEPEPGNSALPDLVNADHFTSSEDQKSFPVLAMQFLVRHFVRCTDFCLICHRSLSDTVEAIKPYVCDSSLCLYQFVALGFGPSIEHEILAQPYVVDLLVSFCYSSASARKLKEFPDGLSLIVPSIDSTIAHKSGVYGEDTRQDPQTPPTTVSRRTKDTSYEVGYDVHTREFIFFDKLDICPVRRGSWIVLKLPGGTDKSKLHCRVSDVTSFPTISIDEPVSLQLQTDAPNSSVHPASWRESAQTSTTSSSRWIASTLHVYDQDFAQLNNDEKCQSICEVLATLPNVKSMQAYLKKSNSVDLKQWVHRISPAAMTLLRWIIASNRACIMQVDGDDEVAQDPKITKTNKMSGASAERVYGMKEYFQFRFAMGAPDKEQRFTTEVRNNAISKQLQYPTFFAWHGSPLHNWHMIIREGLHFKNLDHGRAYGNGVYHAKDARTSTGYSGRHGTLQKWPKSVLNINNALALNEIVNAPEEFVSVNPYYVVSQLDWIQTRYLFVSCTPGLVTISVNEESRPLNAHPQDPLRTPDGMSGKVEIPASAIKSSKYSKDKRVLDGASFTGAPHKKLKGEGGFGDVAGIADDNDTNSVATDDDDLAILVEEPLEIVERELSSDLTTDFVPGVLDWATLPLMPLPEYAVSGTTKHLLKELRNLDQLQESRPIAELGWYIDVQKIENVYQWIVELHSFAAINPALPLVADMLKKSLKSIVLEVRFNKDFPWTPPYVRVIRPRFLNFAQGGGGHVVMGGAMCMELLTNSGWSAVSSMESILLQVRLAIASDPPAKLDMRANGDYGVSEAADGYIRACRSHGWDVPLGFKEMAYGTGVDVSRAA